MVSMTVLMAKRTRARRTRRRAGGILARALGGRAHRDRKLVRLGGSAALAGLLQPPAADLLVVAGEQHVGHAPAAVFGRTRVVGILGQPAERRAEGLLDRRVGSARARPGSLRSTASAARPSPRARRPPARSARSRSHRWRSARRSARRSPRSARRGRSARARRRARPTSASSSRRPPGLSAITRRRRPQLLSRRMP